MNRPPTFSIPATLGRAPLKSAPACRRPLLLLWRRSTLLIAGVACFAATLTFAAASPASMAGFDSANKLYEQGQFIEAVSAYERLLHSGTVSAAVYFNLGNACYKSGQVGRAVAAYRQAGQLAPRDPDLGVNLQFVRNQIAAPTARPGRWEFGLAKLTLDEWTWLATGALWAWFALLILLQWRPRLKPALRGYRFAAGIAAGVLCLCLGAVLYARQATRTAVVTAAELLAHNGPLDESPGAFTLHDGAELNVLDEKNQWLQVSAGTRQAGWIHRDQVILLPRN
jgi:tetratricopeptide (TPR) repeat protein